MMRRVLLQTAVAFHLAASPGAAATAFTGRLSTSGNVWINAVALPSGSSVHPADTIATSASGFAVITSAHTGRIEVRNDSRITLTADSVILHHGVVASERFAVEIGEQRVKPSAPAGVPSHFVVLRRGGRCIVAAHQGGVVIDQGAAVRVLVPPGSYAEEASPPENDAARQTTGEESTASGTASGQASTAAAAKESAWTIGPLSHAASVALLVGAVAAAGSIGTVALTGDDSPSPSR